MGERLLCKQEVIGSIPFTSTNAQMRHAHLSRARQAQRKLRRERLVQKSAWCRKEHQQRAPYDRVKQYFASSLSARGKVFDL